MPCKPRFTQPNKYKYAVEKFSTVIQLNSHSAQRRTQLPCPLIHLKKHHAHTRYVWATYIPYNQCQLIIQMILNAITSHCVLTKQFATIVENQSTKQVVVAMHTHASIRIGATSLSIKQHWVNKHKESDCVTWVVQITNKVYQCYTEAVTKCQTNTTVI